LNSVENPLIERLQSSAGFHVGERPLKPQQKAAIPASVRILRIVLGLRKTASRSFWALIDGRVPGRLKLVAVAAVLFVLSPLNLLGDIPVLGALDDAALLMLVLTWFTRASSPYLNTIDA
jgi:uncharacterized membrane protein YkvA (DUF1232 family)